MNLEASSLVGASRSWRGLSMVAEDAAAEGLVKGGSRGELRRITK